VVWVEFVKHFSPSVKHVVQYELYTILQIIQIIRFNVRNMYCRKPSVNSGRTVYHIQVTLE